MAEANTPEPSIEDILASIRKIISDDDVEADAEHEPKVTKSPEPEEESAEDDVLELTETDRVAAHAGEAVPEPEAEKSNVNALPQAIAMTNEPTEQPHHPKVEDSSIVSEKAMKAATGAFAKLSHVDEPVETRISGDGKTIEDITRELLRPMLRQWVDQNLPAIVERLVERELRKISRKAEDL